MLWSNLVMDKYPIQCGVETLLKNKITMTTGCYLENQFGEGEGRRVALNNNFPNNLQFYSIYSNATCT